MISRSQDRYPTSPGLDATSDVAADVEALRERLSMVLRQTSWLKAGQRLGCSPETLRRQCSVPGSRISLEIVLRVCIEFGLNANWLLFGSEPREGRELNEQIESLVRGTPTGRVFAFIGTTLDLGVGDPYHPNAERGDSPRSDVPRTTESGAVIRQARMSLYGPVSPASPAGKPTIGAARDQGPNTNGAAHRNGQSSRP